MSISMTVHALDNSMLNTTEVDDGNTSDEMHEIMFSIPQPVECLNLIGQMVCNIFM